MAQTLTFTNLEKALEQNNSTLKEWITTQITNVSTVTFLWVESLPTENISTSTIYMLRNAESTDENNIYDEYVYNETSGWEVIGSLNTGKIEVDLSNYYNKTETYSKEEIENLLTKISAQENNAIIQKEDGLFVEDKTNELGILTSRVDEIKKYQKFVNTDMEYGHWHSSSQHTFSGSGNLTTPIYLPLPEAYDTNMQYDTEDNYIVLKAGKRYQILYDARSVINNSVIELSLYNAETDEKFSNTIKSGVSTISSDTGNILQCVVSVDNDTKIKLGINYYEDLDYFFVRMASRLQFWKHLFKLV